MTTAITTHECPGLGCKRHVRPGMLTCPGCWRTVPGRLRSALWAAWDHGTGAGTTAHRAAMNDVIRYLAGGP